MKRTRKLALTSLMAMGGVSLTACDNNPAVSIDHGKQVDAYAYASLQDCLAKDEVPDSACETAQKNADAAAVCSAFCRIRGARRAIVGVR